MAEERFCDVECVDETRPASELLDVRVVVRMSELLGEDGCVRVREMAVRPDVDVRVAFIERVVAVAEPVRVRFIVWREV